MTAVLMAVASFAYLYYCTQDKGYDSRKVAIILSFVFIYIVKSLEDVFWGAVPAQAGAGCRRKTVYFSLDCDSQRLHFDTGFYK